MSTNSMYFSGYRPAKPITDDLRRHCHILLDEGLYTNALSLLTDILIVGASHPQGQEKPAFTPMPFHVELVSILLVHPRYTNQADTDEHGELASQCIVLLRNILGILGPLNFKFSEAFSYGPVALSDKLTSGPCRIATGPGETSAQSDFEDTIYHVRGVIGNKGRIRLCARDFWHMVGWSGNCSAKYPFRWKYLKVWLEYMVDVLVADWKERQRLDLESSNLCEVDTNERNQTLLQQSLIVSYLPGARVSPTTAIRRIVQSLFTDGSSSSLRDFPPVFPNETKELKFHNLAELKKSDVISPSRDIEEELYELEGDKLAVSCKEMDDIKDGVAARESSIGEIEIMTMRQRLFTLLVSVANFLPTHLTTPSELINLLCDAIQPLPLPQFTTFIGSCTTSFLTESIQLSLCQALLCRLLPRSALRPDPNASDTISQQILETCYLPFTAVTSAPVENTKVSLLLEILLRRLIISHRAYATPSLKEALETGIMARQSLASRLGKRARSSQVGDDIRRLTASGIRLQSLLALLKKKLLTRVEIVTDSNEVA
ncbi:unnamed protein product [Blumeria hordei]|uniref:Uncharacterized protein n=2 Tax=Blumeria hordei TaxID=2867405 RepID=A0A383V0K2_BLUHO|nr:hypothetical protein BGHDH14_bghG000305000001001 [Blumeria hordei DH14]SZF05536.1 unnamed protein product [Blumeria hordei]